MIQSAVLTANDHIETVKAQLQTESLSQIDYLVIAHSDHRMIAQLKNALGTKTFAILSLPQGAWKFDSEEIIEFTQWAFGELTIGKVLLVGHSQGGTPNTDQAQAPFNESEGPSLGSLDKRFDLQKQYVKDAEGHFIAELESLRSNPAIENCLLRQQGFVQALFYRWQSNAFCYYDVQNQQFKPLVTHH